MKSINRREVLTSLSVLGSSICLSGCHNHAAGKTASTPDHATPATAASRSEVWNYTELDPAVVGRKAYELYADGSCMYAIVGSVINSLAEKVGEPFHAFPLEMMRYGAGGIGYWGSLCGIVSGGAVMIGLFHHDREPTERNGMISEFCSWYEAAPLPQYQPAQPICDEPIPSSAAGSILCHVAVSQWCETAREPATSPLKKGTLSPGHSRQCDESCENPESEIGRNIPSTGTGTGCTKLYGVPWT